MTTVQYMERESVFRVSREVRNANGSLEKLARNVDVSTLRRVGDWDIERLIERCMLQPTTAHPVVLA